MACEKQSHINDSLSFSIPAPLKINKQKILNKQTKKDQGISEGPRNQTKKIPVAKYEIIRAKHIVLDYKPGIKNPDSILIYTYFWYIKIVQIIPNLQWFDFFFIFLQSQSNTYSVETYLKFLSFS